MKTEKATVFSNAVQLVCAMFGVTVYPCNDSYDFFADEGNNVFIHLVDYTPDVSEFEIRYNVRIREECQNMTHCQSKAERINKALECLFKSVEGQHWNVTNRGLFLELMKFSEVHV